MTFPTAPEGLTPAFLSDALKRPVSDFRVTSDRTLSDHIRAIIEEVSVPQALIERTLDAPFLVEHFLPEQIQGMRDRWLPRSKQPVDRDRPA